MRTSTESLQRAGIELVLASFVVLFQELALIRWLPGQVRVLAYFPNVVLLSAFLGLGIGALRSQSRSLLWLWTPSLALLASIAYGMSNVAFTQQSVTEHLWLLYYDLPKTAPVVQGVRLPIVIAFVLSTLTFIPLGQLIAERLNRFRQGNASLWGYVFDLLGSLIGVIAFAVASFAETTPLIWFSIVLLVAVPFFLRSLPLLSLHAVTAVVILFVVAYAEKADHYSPYYALRQVPLGGGRGFLILANGSQHQYAAPLRRGQALGREGELLRSGYHLPYRLFGRRADEVLILGAGTGNDVAVALDEGAQKVDAVEIDPVILEIGRKDHPDAGYSSPRVTAYATDARSYLNKTDRRYDLVVFGTLDSMTRLSALSNVRLDNFVYTEQSLRAARARLKEDGGLAMYFSVAAPYIDERLEELIRTTFGESPAVIRNEFGSFNRIYLAGPAFAHIPRPPTASPKLRGLTPTDDWPFLYLKNRTLSSFYTSLIAIFAAIALISVLLTSGEMRRSLWRGGGFDQEMFLFGMAFLLLETKAVTEMNLVWGATWLTSAVVFASILLMILLSTIVMQLHPINWWTAAGGLVLSLIINYFTPVQQLVGLGTVPKLAASVLFVGLPLFFASACFALQFKEREQPALAFGWNLLGAVAGGLLEFTSMVLGFKALTLVALAAYVAAIVIRKYRLQKSQILVQT